MSTGTEENDGNEKNEVSGRNRKSRGYNSELEKFKRRLIRAIARMLIHEKRDEDEVWLGLKEQTGCDCKELWNRMHALTVKKLQCLLDAEDQVDKLPKAARMSITDWLLCDSVLVHQDCNLIGMSETIVVDRPNLVILFNLVEEFKIEFLAGKQLAVAWQELTMKYNSEKRQCSPMLLQRRWYQLKLATRERFYTFWSMYKGVVKRLYLGEAYKPTPLQTDIAKRHKTLVVTPFMQWEDMIENNLVVLPEDFESKAERSKQTPSEENSPDVMCVEPDIETIDLGIDSDSELEYRKPAEESEETTISIKPEPNDDVTIEENVPYVNREEKISNFADAALEATAMELNDLRHDENKCVDLDIEEACNIPTAEDNVIPTGEDNVIPTGEDNVIPTGEDNVIVDNEQITAVENDIITTVEDEVTELPLNKLPLDELPDVVENIEETENKPNPPIVVDEHDEVSSITENSNEIHPIQHDLEMTDINVVSPNDQETLLPQITSIFGGVDVNKETLSKIGKLTAEITNSGITVMNNIPKVKIQEDPDTIDISSDSIDDFPADDELINNEASSEKNVEHELNMDIDVKPDITKNNWFGELSHDIDFADDGIQLVDEGISYHDKEFVYEIDQVKDEIKVDKDDFTVKVKLEEDEYIPKVDKKLLMIPTVLILKLDDMGILPIHLLEHVDNKTIIDMISFKSEPIIKIKQEVDSMSESSEEEILETIRKVKLSSALLQKPRNREYNSIQLCKNPDFNTRLKRLNVGFFSSFRNRMLLKACHPLTIDLSKAFENRLVNGTMYLNTDDVGDFPKNSLIKDSNQNASIVPSAMPAQSLIDITNELSSVEYAPSEPKQDEINEDKAFTSTCLSEIKSERNKVINLPDISEIRRINQKLLTAQVSPLQMKGNKCEVPVKLVPTQNPCSDDVIYTKTIPGPASRTKFAITNKPTQEKVSNVSKTLTLTDLTRDNDIISHTPSNDIDSISKPPAINLDTILQPPTINLDTISQNLIINLDEISQVSTKTKDLNKPVEKVQKKINSRPVFPSKPRVPNQHIVYTPDTLLALDTLNKMLYLLTEPLHEEDVTAKNKKIKKKYKTHKTTLEELTGEDVTPKNKKTRKENKILKPKNITHKTTLEDNDDVQVVETIDKSVNAKKPAGRLKKNLKPVFCCWAREKICQMIYPKKRISRHNCPLTTSLLCLCCCKDDLVKVYAENRKKNQSQINHHTQTNPCGSDAILIPDDASKSVSTEINTETTNGLNESVKDKLSCNNDSVQDDVIICATVNCEGVVSECTQTALTSEINKPVLIKEPEQNVTPPSNNDPVVITKMSCKSSVSTQTVEDAKEGVCDPIESTSTANTSTNIAVKPKIRVLRGKPATEVQPNLEILKTSYPVSRNCTSVETVKDNLRVYSAPNKTVTATNTLIANKPQISETAHSISSAPINPQEANQKLAFINRPKSKAVAKSSVNPKMLYLNSKLISELPSDNPIFLGKKNILLTTAIFPRNFKAFEAFQRHIKQSLYLPKGIQITLQPNGKLIFRKDPNIAYSAQFLEKLPHLIEAIQVQIDAPTPIVTLNIKRLDTNIPDEVINLCDDETPAETNDELNNDGLNDSSDPSITLSNSSENCIETLVAAVQPESSKDIQNEEINKQGNEDITYIFHEDTPEVKDNSNNNTALNDTGTLPITDTLDVTKQISPVENTASIEKDTINCVKVDDNTTTELENTDFTSRNFNATSTAEVTDSKNCSISTIPQETNIQVHENEMSIPVDVEEAIDNLSSCVIPSEPLEVVKQNIIDDSENVGKEIKKGKTKNILSDLMAMSGIGLIDISPTAQESLPPELNTPELQPLEDNLKDKLPVAKTNCVTNTELTAITSLSELKYACLQKGSFFKLDLDSGLLAPINVCMKRITESFRLNPLKQTSSEPKSFIDLTDDDISVVTEISPPPLINCDTYQPNDDSKTSNSEGESTPKKVNQSAPKPIRLFKSSLSQPNALLQRLKAIRNRVNVTSQSQQSLIRKRRKQDLTQVGDTTDYKITLNNKRSSSECSSDEEPLAKIALKKRASEKELKKTANADKDKIKLSDHLFDTDEAADVQRQSVACSEKQSVSIEIGPEDNDVNMESQIESTEEPSLGPDEPMDEANIDGDVDMDCLDEQLLEEDQDEEDCILGV